MLIVYVILAVCGAVVFPGGLAGALRSSKMNNSSGVVYNSILATIGVLGMSIGLPLGVLTYTHFI
jgi:hypothetical protein